ncbi:hypothetical protein [Caldisericum sp. AR60]|uniref:hypothetical protein n=1 Tax=Caldisericum sp. AR60 TaxID=3397852 RepID=UPI0039FC0ABB
MSLETCQKVCMPLCLVSGCVVLPEETEHGFRGHGLGEYGCLTTSCADYVSNPSRFFAGCDPKSVGLSQFCCGYGYSNGGNCSFGCVNGKCVKLSLGRFFW